MTCEDSDGRVLPECSTIRNQPDRSLSVEQLASPADRLAKAAIAAGRIIADPDTGVVTYPNGKRAEFPDRNAYGRVVVQRKPKQVWAQAHRIIWIAAHGLIPAALQINHLNKLRWDNRLANLELVTGTGNVNHAYGRTYDSIGTMSASVSPEWLETMELPEEREQTGSPYAHGFRGIARAKRNP